MQRRCDMGKLMRNLINALAWALMLAGAALLIGGLLVLPEGVIR